MYQEVYSGELEFQDLVVLPSLQIPPLLEQFQNSGTLFFLVKSIPVTSSVVNSRLLPSEGPAALVNEHLSASSNERSTAL